MSLVTTFFGDTVYICLFVFFSATTCSYCMSVDVIGCDIGRLRRIFARRRLRKGFERVSTKDVSRDELQHLHQSDDINTDSDDYTTSHQRA